MTEGYNIAAGRSCRKACHRPSRMNASDTLRRHRAVGRTEATAGESRYLPDAPPATASHRMPGRPPTVDWTLRHRPLRLGSGR